MTTLHALRRTYALSFSELAVLTSVPARRLAAFEYHGHTLASDERQSLAALFGIADYTLEGGLTSHVATRPTLTQAQAQALALLAATVTLAWGLRAGQPWPAHIPNPAQAERLTTLAADPPLNQLAGPAVPAAAAAAPATTSDESIKTNAWPTTSQQRARMASEKTVGMLALLADISAYEAEPGRATGTAQPSQRRAQSAPLVAGAAEVIQPTPERTVSSVNKDIPHRCPVEPAHGHVVITQGYDVGTHAPRAQWGGLDLAIMDGPTKGTTIVATHDGQVRVVLNSWPGGNFVAVSGGAKWRTSYAHLDAVYVHTGEFVAAGTPLGTVGSTGRSTGPHLHYETWHDNINVDPSPVLSCD